MVYGNRYLTQDESDSNAYEFFSYMSTKGFSLNAISGMLGNIYMESGVNPGIWENLEEGNLEGGFGLVQWTPATNYINWAIEQGYSTYDKYGVLRPQMDRILYEFNNGLQYIETVAYPLSASEFMISDAGPEYLAEVFLKNYERAGVEKLEERKQWARYYYTTFKEVTPNPDVPSPDTPSTKIRKSKFNFILFNKRRRNQWIGRN